MPQLNPPDLSELKLFEKNPALGDPGLPVTPIAFKLSETQSADLTENGAKVGAVSLEFSATTSIAFVNDAKDPDPEGLFDLQEPKDPAAEDPEAAPEIAPPIVFDATKAYVVLSGITATGKLAGEGTSGALGLGLDASGQLSAAFCREVPRATTIRDATLGTFRAYKSIFHPADLQALGPGETVTLGLGGKLKLGLDLTAASVADAIAGAVQGTLGKLIAIETTGTAKISVSFEVEGGYRVYAQAAAAGGVQFTVRKATSRIIGVEGTVGVTAALKDPAAIAQPLFDQLARITGLPPALLDKIEQSASVEALSDDEKKLFQKAVEKLGLDDPKIDAWQALKKAIEDAKKKVQALLEKKAEAAFTYTWRRTTKQTAVARFVLQGDALARHHANLLRLDIDAIRADRASATNDVRFDRFLGKKVDTIETGHGFALGWGDFTLMKSWTTRSTRFIWQRDLDDRVQVAFLGKRGYEETWFGDKTTHVCEIDASTPHFSAPPPRPGDFELQLQATFTWKDNQFGDIAREVADHGLLIGALAGSDVSAATVALYQAGLPSRQAGQATVSIQVPAAATAALLAGIARGEDLLARALSRALPCGSYGENFEARRNVARRTAAYAPIWTELLRAKDLELDVIGRFAAAQLKDIDGSLSRNEDNNPTLRTWSLRGIVEINGGLARETQKISLLLRALLDLHQRASSAEGLKVFETAAGNASPFCGDRYGARTFAALLYLAAEREPGLLPQIARKVSFTWKDNDEHTLVFQQGVIA